MKIFKKILKCLIISGTIVASIKLLIRTGKFGLRLEDYNENLLMKSKVKNYSDKPFKRDSLAMVCSSAKLDFNNSEMKEKESNLSILGRFSAIKVLVPESWKVDLDGTAINSEVVERIKNNDEDENAPTLNIDYDLKYSALSITNAKSEDEETEETEEIEEIEENEFESIEE